MGIEEARYEAAYGKQLDAKHESAWASYGYKQSLTFDDYYKAYERQAAAHGAVHRLLDKCWSDIPTIKVGDTESAEANTLIESLDGWRKLRDLDRRNLVGRYAGLVAIIGDGKELQQPADGGKVVGLVPVWENQLDVTAWDTDITSARYGQPVLYNYTEAGYFTGEAQPARQITVHWSRVFIFAEGSESGTLYDGVPLLRAGFNKLVDLEKVSGGSAEGFLKNAGRQVAVEFDETADLSTPVTDSVGQTKTVGAAFNDKIKALNKSIDAAIVMQGGKVVPLSVTVPDPEPSWQISANEFACSIQVPFTILFGQQTGRLASDQDKRDWADRCMSRRKNALAEMVSGFLTWMANLGQIKPAKYAVEWSDLNASSDSEKLENAKKMADINKQSTGTGVEAPFAADEIRLAAGYDGDNA